MFNYNNWFLSCFNQPQASGKNIFVAIFWVDFQDCFLYEQNFQGDDARESKEMNLTCFFPSKLSGFLLELEKFRQKSPFGEDFPSAAKWSQT